ncbi:MAG TPA: hypothetical protein VM283_08595, partial [Armatimonadota bacterium]|nr:hypothetical protein [Armatimonadota bacterium]
MALELCQCDKESDLYVPRPAHVVAVEPQTEMETLIRLKLDSGEELGHVPGQFAQLYLPAIGEAPFG